MAQSVPYIFRSDASEYLQKGGDMATYFIVCVYHDKERGWGEYEEYIRLVKNTEAGILCGAKRLRPLTAGGSRNV